MANPFFTLFGVFVAAVAADYPNPGTVTGDYAGVHDPSLVKTSSGEYILYSTGSGLPIRTSTDRTAWTDGGSVFDTAPSATDTFTGTTNGDLWAPDVTLVDGTYWLYYSASSFGSQDSGIFLATSTTGEAGSFTDQGLVISTADGDDWNAIDPHLVIDGDDWYLSAGSFWTGIKLIPLDSSTGLVSGAIISISERTDNDGAEEASWIYATGGYYYLFTSFDTCCAGTSSTYNIRVSRASAVTGPYADEDGVAALDGGGTEILGTHDSIYGPGGQSLLDDSDAVVLVYHYYDATTSYLGINLLDFSSGWPVVY